MTNQQPSDRDRLRAALSDDFEILEELGRGGMGVVFRARDRALGRDVAIKVLPAHLMKDSALIDRFEHEARTAANLEHPNIIPIHRVGRAGVNGNVSYFVMKLLRPESLSDVLRKRGKLPPDELRTLIIETVSALGYAAKRSVVHRDIKPGNILFDSEGRSILTDFGIAKTPDGKHSAPGMVVGSPRYMSPEHALSIPLDGRSDLYSLGVVAYEALVGRAPFEDDNPLEIIYQHIHEPLPQPQLSTAEERELFRVIARMLAKRPGDRFQRADDVIVALGGQVMPHAVAEDPAVTAPVPLLSEAPTERAPILTPTRRWMTMAAIGALAVAVPAVAFVLARPTPKIPAPSPSQRSVVSPPPTTKTPAVATTSTSTVKGVVASPPPKPKPAPPPKPSARAAAILAYNKLRSSCAKRDTIASAKPIDFAVLTDPLADRPRAAEMTVVYDICGLPAGTSFITTFTLTKLRQRGFRQQKPHEETAAGTVGSPRSRHRRSLDTHEMSPGSYRLDMVVKDKGGRTTSASREFAIIDK